VATPSLRITSFARPKKSASPANAIDTPAPQKKTTRPSSRAISSSSGIDGPLNEIQLTDLTFAIFDELVPTELLERLDIGQVIRYRKASEKHREAFLEHVAVLHAKQDPFGTEGDYAAEINKLVITEILPAAREFRNKLQTTRETLFGALVKEAIGAPNVPVLLGLLGYLSLGNLLTAAGVYVAKAPIDQTLAERGVRRECSISYILSLDEYG